jgi:uncharacterized cysteine cluster protein YcgN (CxxCxxCC family)
LLPFWERKTLGEMTGKEWESLCDGCGRCCLKKLEDAETGRIAYTDVACRMLDREQCRCTGYAMRRALVPDCVKLDAHNLDAFRWLPSTCAYRRLAEGKGLEWWHPLVSGDPRTVHEAGISIRGRALSEIDFRPEDLEHRVIRWIKAPRLRVRKTHRLGKRDG